MKNYPVLSQAALQVVLDGLEQQRRGNLTTQQQVQSQMQAALQALSTNISGVVGYYDQLPTSAPNDARYLSADDSTLYRKTAQGWAPLVRLPRAYRPYEIEMWRYCSGSLFATTATTNSAQPKNVVLADMGDFRIGDGIRIRQAGAGATDLITVITAIDRAAKTITLRDQAYNIKAGLAVDHDDTEGFQRALDENWPLAVAAGQNLKLLFDAGVFRLNGPTQERYNGRYRARVCLPYLEWADDYGSGNPLTIELIGHSVPPMPSSGGTDPAPLAGTIFICEQGVPAEIMGAAIIGGPIAEGQFWRDANNFPARSLLNVVTRNITIRQNLNSGHFALDLRQTMSAVCSDLRFDTPTAMKTIDMRAGIFPYDLNSTHSDPMLHLQNRGGGLFLPSMRWGNNFGNISAVNITSTGQMIGLLASEHAAIDNYVGQRCFAGVAVEDGFHAITCGAIDLEQCHVDVWRVPPRFAGAPTPALTIEHLDLELNDDLLAMPRVHDYTDTLRGAVNYSIVAGGSNMNPQRTVDLPIIGGSRVRWHNLVSGLSIPRDPQHWPIVKSHVSTGFAITNSPQIIAPDASDLARHSPAWLGAAYTLSQSGDYRITLMARLADGADAGVSYGFGVAQGPNPIMDNNVFVWRATAGARNNFQYERVVTHVAGIPLSITAYADQPLDVQYLEVVVERIR